MPNKDSLPTLKFILLTSILLYVQVVICSPIDSNKINSPTSFTTHTVDTVLINFNDSLIATSPKNMSEPVKVYIREIGRSSFLKDILPVLTLILGIVINRLLDLVRDRRQIKKEGERWNAELSSLISPIESQIDYLQEFKEEHDKEIWQVPRLNAVQILDGQIFNALDKSRLIKYFHNFKKLKNEDAIKISNKVHVFINILKNNAKNLQSNYDAYTNGVSIHTASLNKHLQDFMVKFGDYSTILEKELNGDPIDDPRYRPIWDLTEAAILPFTKNGDFDIYQLENEFLTPMIEFIAIHRLDADIYTMAESVRGCINSIKALKMEKRYLSENLSSLIESYSEDKTNLEQILGSFN